MWCLWGHHNEKGTFCCASNYCAHSCYIKKKINTKIFFELMRTGHQPLYLRCRLRGKTIFEETREEGLPFLCFMKDFFVFCWEESHRKINKHQFKAKMISHTQVTFFFLLTFLLILVFCSSKDSYRKRQGLFNCKHNSERGTTKPHGTSFPPSLFMLLGQVGGWGGD